MSGNTKFKTRLERWVLIGLTLSILNASLGMSIANVALPTLSEFFQIPIQMVQWVVLAYLLTVTVTVVSVGRLGDIFGNRKVLLFGILLFIFSSLLCGLSTRFWMLIVARGLQGMGGAALVALPMALVRDFIPKKRLGLAMGLLGTTSAIGTMLGPSLGGILIASFDWPFIFTPLVVIGILNLVFIYRFLPQTAKSTKFQVSIFDIRGTLTLMASLICYTLSVTLEKSVLTTEKILLFGGSIIGILLFIRVEKQVKNPLINLALFKDRDLTFSLLMNFLIATVMMSTLIVGPFYLSGALNFKENTIGLILSIGPFASALSGLPAGKIVDRFGTKNVLVLALCLMTIAAFALAFLPMYFGLTGYVGAIILLTPAYQLFLAANNTHVMSEAKSSQQGVIAGTLSLSRNIGLISGASVMGAIFAMAMAHHADSLASHSIIHGLKVTYIIAGFMVSVCLLLAIATLNIHSGKSQPT
ncbi:MFS transporter [Ekhidna sp. MALMAid0563]|uniref:MFS transporter n=1 Tax=Ekhidna sp. MALMAid0563 TaxID=3143937 RepID=UPI0032DFCA50